MLCHRVAVVARFSSLWLRLIPLRGTGRRPVAPYSQYTHWRFIVNNARARSRSLHYEPLESREMMAVSATLKGGVLKVKGTKHADRVDFSQSTDIIL